MGGRARLVIASAHGPRCIAADTVAAEIIRHIPRLAELRKLDATTLLAALKAMPVEWKPPESYADRFKEATQRMASRDPDDAPTVALALKIELPVWSQEKDLGDAGVEVFTTGELLDALRKTGHGD